MDLAVIHYYLASKILWYICYNLKLNQSGKITNMCSTKCPRAMNIQTTSSRIRDCFLWYLFNNYNVSCPKTPQYFPTQFDVLFPLQFKNRS